MEDQPLYAYAYRRGCKEFRIYQESSPFPEHPVKIPVSQDSEIIRQYGEHQTGQLEHILVNLAPLVDAGIILKESLIIHEHARLFMPRTKERSE